MAEKDADFGTQSGKAKSKHARLVGQIARLVRHEGLDYEGGRYLARRGRSSAHETDTEQLAEASKRLVY